MSSEKLVRKGLLSELDYYSTLTLGTLLPPYHLCKIVNIYHRYPNKIFIMPIMTNPYCILGVVSWLNYQFKRKINYCSISCPVKIEKIFD